MKECFKCLNVLPLSEFYRHKYMADGHLNKCKSCTKQDVKKHYNETRPARSEYERKRFADPKRKANLIRYQRNSRKRNPEKNTARRLLNRAVATGKLFRMPCKHCGEVKTEAHHTDYSKPLDVEWLCFKCHRVHGHGQVVISDTQTKTTEGPSHGG
jgi:hypothetical protein